jgi:hypothetical protein
MEKGCTMAYLLLKGLRRKGEWDFIISIRVWTWRMYTKGWKCWKKGGRVLSVCVRTIGRNNAISTSLTTEEEMAFETSTSKWKSLVRKA